MHQEFDTAIMTCFKLTLSSVGLQTFNIRARQSYGQLQNGTLFYETQCTTAHMLELELSRC